MRHIGTIRHGLLASATALLLPGLPSCSDQPADSTAPTPERPPATVESARSTTPPPPAGDRAEMATMDVPTADAGQPAWSAPDDWIERPTDGIRRATWTVPGPDDTTAELSVTVFPGDVGGLPANITRWRRQLGLPAGADPSQPETERLDGSPLPFAVVSIDGRNEQSILVGVLPDQGRTWFFKMMGDTPAVRSQADAFRDFLRTVRLDG